MYSDKIAELMAQGYACSEKCRLAEAVEWYKKATEVDPESFVAHANLGTALFRLHYYEEAISAYLIALKKKRNAPLVLRNLGECFENTNRLEIAKKYYQEAVKAKPDFAESMTDLGNVYQKQGDNEEAIGWYRRALGVDALFSSARHNVGLCLYDDRDLKKAEEAFRIAVEMDPDNGLGACFLGIVLEHEGKYKEAGEVFQAARQLSEISNTLIESSRYAFKNSHKTRYFSNTNDVLRYAIKESKKEGLFMEFGVYYGNSLRVIAESIDKTVHGFDSFEGLPEDWFVGDGKGAVATEPAGAYATRSAQLDLPGNVMLHAGWFDDTLPEFMNGHKGSVSFLNIDCDIYSSTKTILSCLKERIKGGTIIVFDEYFCYPEWREHEYKAFQEFISSSRYVYEYIAFSYFTGQAVVRILDN